jgi:hypothetical protein
MIATDRPRLLLGVLLGPIKHVLLQHQQCPLLATWEEIKMLKIAALVWIMVGTVFAGAAVAAVLSVPQLAAEAMRYLPIAGIGGYIVAMPVAWLLAWRMTRTAAG